MTSDPRCDELTDWLAGVLAGPPGALTAITNDASQRRYFRVSSDAGSRIAMDAPPPHEATAPFIDIAARLAAAGIEVPQVLAADRERGFLLLSDLGDRLYLDALNTESADALYGDALARLIRMQCRLDASDLAPYDHATLCAEMDLFGHWFLDRHLGVAAAATDPDLAAAQEALAAAALEQPRVFVHRDYHSRNLLVTGPGGPGVIDFQDALAGPLTYDLASLLRDCYIAWPEERITGWLEHYRSAAATAGLAMPDAATLRRWFDLMGAQRHLKAIGIFARLYHRDGKARYLADIPRTWHYLQALFGRHPELDPLARLAERLDIQARLELAPTAVVVS